MSSTSVVCRRFSLREIEDAKAKPEKILGEGAEGKVYMGRISATCKVAIKCLKSNFIKFEEEIKIVSKMKHPHLVSLHGYCEESDQKILVYEYMEKGSLSKYISTPICWPWQQRLSICLGAARGLQYLHKETEELPKGIIHRDIKPNNILLDNNWVAKILDFGLSKISHAGQNESTVITELKGTRGYYAPEYIYTNSITRKIDIYSFGMVLFEVLCRKKPWDRGDESCYGLEDVGFWAGENVDPEIKEEISADCLEAFTHIIGRSLLKDPKRRPTMDDVVMDLEGAIKCQERQDEGVHSKAPTRVMVNMSSGLKGPIPGSVRKMIQEIKSITKNSEDEIYAMLKECYMDPFKTTRKLLLEVRNSNETTADIPESTTEIPESSNAVALDNDRHIIMSVEEMEAFRQKLKEATNNLEGSSFHRILNDTDRLVACLTTTVAKSFQSGLAGQFLWSCKYALHTLMQIFSYKLLAHAVLESTLDGLIKELLNWLINERLPELDDDGTLNVKALNISMLKILDGGERKSFLVVLINLFPQLDPSIQPYSRSFKPHDANSRRFCALVITCLIKLTKVAVEKDEPRLSETQITDINHTKTVHVKVQLEKECSYHQSFHIVGDDPLFGLWDPEFAEPMKWSDGHVWFVELVIPIGKTLNFEFVMKDEKGTVSWQPGSNRVLQIWEILEMKTICEDWDNSESRKIIEMIPLSYDQLENNQEKLIDAEYFVADPPIILENSVEMKNPEMENNRKAMDINSFSSLTIESKSMLVEDVGVPVLVPV